jgi:hypothetical protein
MIETVAADFMRKGKLEAHHLRVVSRREDEELAFKIASAMSDHFLKVTTHTLAERKRSAIGLGNDMFRAAFQFLRDHRSALGELQDPPLLYFDPSYRPSSNGWVDTLQAEFYLRQSPLSMGRTLPGKEPKSRVYVGPVLFSRAFADTEALNLLDEAFPWRERLQWLLAKDSVETKLIGPGNKSVIRQKT